MKDIAFTVPLSVIGQAAALSIVINRHEQAEDQIGECS
jgi:hypothetical protein